MLGSLDLMTGTSSLNAPLAAAAEKSSIVSYQDNWLGQTLISAPTPTEAWSPTAGTLPLDSMGSRVGTVPCPPQSPRRQMLILTAEIITWEWFLLDFKRTDHFFIPLSSLHNVNICDWAISPKHICILKSALKEDWWVSQVTHPVVWTSLPVSASYISLVVTFFIFSDVS